MSKLPFSIFQYSSYLEFLQDAYEFFHSKDESFSFEKIAVECGLKSRTEARNILKGIKRCTESDLSRIALLFSLEVDERKYLSCLHRFHEAGADPAAFDIFQILIGMQRRNLPTTDPFREIEIATSVLHMTLLSTLELGNTSHDPVQLVSLLKGRYTLNDIESALNDLLKYGYIQKNGSNGDFKVCQKHIKKYDYNSNFFLKRYHTESLEIAKSALENESTSERYLVGASFCINSKIFPRIIQKMNAFVENLMQLEGVAGSPDMVIQINQQLVKMTVGHANNERVLGRETAERVLD